MSVIFIAFLSIIHFNSVVLIEMKKYRKVHPVYNYKSGNATL